MKHTYNADPFTGIIIQKNFNWGWAGMAIVNCKIIMVINVEMQIFGTWPKAGFSASGYTYKGHLHPSGHQKLVIVHAEISRDSII